MQDEDSLTLKSATDCALREVMTAIQGQRLSKLGQALRALTTHVANNWKAICVLHDATDREATLGWAVANPVAVLIRCMYDALLQALYVAADPVVAEERATHYLEFCHVEHRRFDELIEGGTSALSQRLARSQKRASRENEHRAEYDRVKARYSDRRGKLRDHWYKGNLRAIAESIGKDENYSWYIAFSNSSVHAGALSVFRGPLVPFGDHTVDIAASIVAQAIRLLIDNVEVGVSEQTEKFVAENEVDFFHGLPTT